ncbi:MAG: 30S ribosomal protein S5 [bacterium]
MNQAKRQNNNNNNYKNEDSSDTLEKVLKIDRVTKVVKGGKRLAFRAFVVVGDKNGNVSYGLGKAREVPKAIKKAIEKAHKSLININVVDTTLPHPIIGKFASTKVIMKPAGEGTGIIAGSSAKVIFEAVGIKNIVAKIHGARNKINVAKATMAGLTQLLDVKQVESLRGVQIPVFLKKQRQT